MFQLASSCENALFRICPATMNSFVSVSWQMPRNSSVACYLSRLSLNSMKRLSILSLISFVGLILLYFSKLRPTTLSVFRDTLRPTNLIASSSSLWLSSASFFSSLLGARLYNRWYMLRPCIAEGDEGFLVGLYQEAYFLSVPAPEMLEFFLERLLPPVCACRRAASRASLLPFGTYFFRKPSLSIVFLLLK